MFTLFVILGGIALCAAPVILIIAIVNSIRKKNPKKWWKIFGVTLLLFLVFELIASAVECKHDYKLVDELAPTCTEGGYLKYHCDKCDRDKTDYVDELEHNMKITSRVEPTENLEGEIVRTCSRCGHEEVQTVEKLEKKTKKQQTETKKTKEQQTETKKASQTDWKTVFANSGFSEKELAEYEEMFTTVGITDYHDVTVVENGVMHIIRGKIYDSEQLQLNVTMENRKIFLIELAGLPATETEAYINWRGKIKFKTVNTTKSVDLYYDADGGYLAKLDWENKTITAIE